MVGISQSELLVCINITFLRSFLVFVMEKYMVCFNITGIYTKWIGFMQLYHNLSLSTCTKLNKLIVYVMLDRERVAKKHTNAC